MVDSSARVWLVAVREEIGSIRVLTDNATASGMTKWRARMIHSYRKLSWRTFYHLLQERCDLARGFYWRQYAN